MLAGMAGVPYDPEHIARFFDEYGTREWERFDGSPMDHVGLEVHLRLLREHIQTAIAFSTRGRVPVASRSSWLGLERGSLQATSRRGNSSCMPRRPHRSSFDRVARAARHPRSEPFRDASFDAVVCFGGPISYVLGEADAHSRSSSG